jgi:hypothetical protein
MVQADRVQSLSSYVQSAAMRFPRECRRDLWHVDAKSILRSSFRSFFCPATMLHLSHLIEDEVLNKVGITEVHASFQSLWRMTPQLIRYGKIGQSVMGQWVYGALDADLPTPPRTAFVNTRGTEFARHWWVIATGPGISMCLIGEEVPCQRFEARQYRGFYTNCEATTHEVLDIIRAAFPEQVPPRIVRPMSVSFDALPVYAAPASIAGD